MICQGIKLMLKLQLTLLKMKLKCIKLEANLCILASALSVSCNFSISFTCDIGKSPTNLNLRSCLFQIISVGYRDTYMMMGGLDFKM